MAKIFKLAVPNKRLLKDIPTDSDFTVTITDTADVEVQCTMDRKLTADCVQKAVEDFHPPEQLINRITKDLRTIQNTHRGVHEGMYIGRST